MKKIVVPELSRLASFSQAVVGGDCIYVAGTLGVRPGTRELAEGGTGPETTQALRNIETILEACGASLADLVKVNVFLRDIQTFPDMNEAYMAVIGSDPPARITVGRSAFGLDAAVEIDGVAYKPGG
jgi:2-iminobutanoate/2-iminopropanoate deaminase